MRTFESTSGSTGSGTGGAPFPGDFQNVKIEVVLARSMIPTYTQLEHPYSYIVSVSPWLFLLSRSGKKNPHAVRWTSQHRFELYFRDKHFRNQSSLKTPPAGLHHTSYRLVAKKAAGVYVADSGDVVPIARGKDNRFRYTIRIWPPKPYAKSEAESIEAQKAFGADPIIKNRDIQAIIDKEYDDDEYVIMIDPDYVFED